jgi:large subunit ribosomal protein L10
MALSLEEKKAVVAEVSEVAKGAFSAVAAEYCEGTDFECMSERLTGPLILAFSQEDPGAAARVTKDFAKGHEKFEVTMLSVGGELLEATDIDKLAKLPTRDQAISLLMAVMLAPTEKLVRTLNEVPGKLVRTVAAIREQKEQAA